MAGGGSSSWPPTAPASGRSPRPGSSTRTPRGRPTARSSPSRATGVGTATRSGSWAPAAGSRGSCRAGTAPATRRLPGGIDEADRLELPGRVPAVVAAVTADVAGVLLRPPVGVLLDHVVEQLLDAVAVGDRLEHGRAALARRLDGERAGVDEPVPQRLPVGDVGDPGQPDVATVAGQDALPEEQAVGGDHVVR